MREHSRDYLFESVLILTPDRVQTVILEQILIRGLFQEIAVSNDERLESLSRFFQIIINGHF